MDAHFTPSTPTLRFEGVWGLNSTASNFNPKQKTINSAHDF